MPSPELPSRYKDPAGRLPIVLGLFRDINTLATQEGGSTSDVVRSGSYAPKVYVDPSPVTVEARLIDTRHFPRDRRFGTPVVYDLCVQGFGRTLESIGIDLDPSVREGFEAGVGDDMLSLSLDPAERALMIEHLISSFYIRYGIDALVRQITERGN